MGRSDELFDSIFWITYLQSSQHVKKDTSSLSYFPIAGVNWFSLEFLWEDAAYISLTIS